MSADTRPVAKDGQSLSSRLNWLRAGVLGSNDGIISTAGLVFGVAGATTDITAILIAGLAGLVAGSLSMAGGEYVSVSSQRDTEISASAKKQNEFKANPTAKRAELIQSYISKGVGAAIAKQFVDQLSDPDVEATELSSLGIDTERPVSPWVAAGASLISFVIGSLIPLLAMAFTPVDLRLPGTFLAVVLALVITGFSSARLSDSHPGRPIVRNVVVGLAAMGVTYLVGSLFHLAG